MSKLKFIIVFILIFISGDCLWAQNSLEATINGILTSNTEKPFNGVILISRNGKTEYVKAQGFSDIDAKAELEPDDPFVIGSLSKQITAVIVLREYDKGHLKLHTPIREYLPNLKMDWANVVTVHHLLSHTHGIVEDGLNQPLAFTPGTQFAYSQTGYRLLAEIAEKVSGKSFSSLSSELFRQCGMANSFHPDVFSGEVNGYIEEGGVLRKADPETGIPVAAGRFISTAADLVIWNNCLHGGKILSDGTYKLMITRQKNAVRDHRLFGHTTYGYGITVEDAQLGHTGMISGFSSLNFYYPGSNSSLVVLSNVQYYPGDLKKNFYYHLQIWEAVRGQLK